MRTSFLSFSFALMASVAFSPLYAQQAKAPAAQVTQEAKAKKPKAVAAKSDTASSGPERGKSVSERTHSDYTAEGGRVGAFIVKPTIALQETYDSNIYATHNNEKSDYVTNLRPGVEVTSDWSRHEVKFDASGNFGLYSDHNDEDFADFQTGVSGRADVLRETFVTGGLDYKRLHEDRGSPDNSTNSKEPTEYSDAGARVGFFRGLQRVSVKLDQDAHQLDYKDGKTATGTVIDQDYRDRNQYKTTGRLGYEIHPGYEAFLRSSYDVRRYDHRDATNIKRDSEGYDAVVGTALDLSGKLRGEVYGGYMTQDYDAATLKTAEGGTFGGSLLWNPTSITSVRTNIARTIEETTQASASSYISTAYRVDVEHELQRNVLLGVNGGFANNAYEGAAAGAVERSDDVWDAGLTARYLLNRNASVDLKYSHQARDSNLVNQDYDRDQVTVGVGLAM